jgi:hypothetical protein
MKVVWVIAVFCLLPVCAPSQKVTMIGPGLQTSCGTWLEHRRRDDAISYAIGSWVLGYLSGVASTEFGDVMDGTDSNGVLYWITSYCQSNPAVQMVESGNAFIRSRGR